MEVVYQRAERLIEGYDILARIGKGGMGTVFKAVHLDSGKLVALKILPISLAKDRNYIRRFLREARAASELSHPNITRVFEVGNYRGVFYFTMEYVEGETLLERITRFGRLTATEALRIAEEVARGLAHAHKHKIVHRDVKPENIIIATDGTVKLTDLGLAKRIDDVEQDITVTGQVVGTPCYMSPEQISAPKTVDHRADIYALGATLYHMVTGRRPHLAETSAKTMLNVLNKPLLFSEQDKVPQPVQELIWRLTAKDRSARPQSAEQAISEIHMALQALKRGVPLRLQVAPRRRKKLSVPLGWVVASLIAATIGALIAAALSAAPPKEALPLFRKGVALAEKGRWNEALDLFNQALRLDSSLAGAWNNRGTCLFHLGRLAEACRSYEIALELDPRNALLHKNYGSVLLALGRYDEAVKAFEEALRLEPRLEAARKGLKAARAKIAEQSK